MYNLNFISAKPELFTDLYRLKSEKHCVYWSGFNSAPDYDRFKIHYQKELNRADRTIIFLYIEDEFAGYIALDFCNADNTVETSHGVVQAFTGNSFGKNLIEYAVDYSIANIPEAKTMIGWIADNNYASIKNFLDNGYIKTGDVDFRTLQQEDNKVKFEKYIRTLR